jgi:hypothetical protein
MIIVIDFDGTIVSGDNYPNITFSKLLCREVIQSWYDDGNEIIINSCRTGRYEGMAVDFLVENNIPFHYFNCNLPVQIQHFKMDCRKISGDVYIDDKNLGGIPDNWIDIDIMVRKHPKYVNKKRDSSCKVAYILT